MGGHILVVSDGTLTASEGLVEAVNRAGMFAAHERDPVTALTRLRSQPRPIIIDAAMAGAERFVGRVRSEGVLAGCAVVAVVPQPSDAAFSEALAWGADEVVPAASLGSLTHVAQNLKDHAPHARPPATLGTVLVANASVEERRTRARPLRNVGFEVLFASDLNELDIEIARHPGAILAIDSGLFPTGLDGLREFLRRDAIPNAVAITVAAHEVDVLSSELAHRKNIRVLARHDPPEDTIFVANELQRPVGLDGRASERFLHASVVSFRIAGHETPTHGISYNVSREGIYVRTLVPLPRETDVWIEMRPPMLDGLVHLEAKVVWARRFGFAAGATAPAGFGARITGGSERSMARWLEGYSSLSRSRHAPQA